MATAVEIFDAAGGMYPGFEYQNGALVGWRWFVVDAQDPLQVLAAAGLPGNGDAYPGIPSIRAVDRRPQRAGPATTFVQVYYRFNATAGTPLPDPDQVSQDGDAYSEILPGLTTFEARTDITGKLLPQPVSREAPSQELVVHVYTAGAVSDAAITDFLPLRGKLNANPVSAPPRWTGSVSIGLAPGMLLARTFSEEPVRDGLYRVSFRFGLAPAGGWKAALRRVDANGNPTGPITEYDVYESVNFNTGGLW